MKAAIIQSNYLPWKGYFDIIHDVDTFVFLEDVQYTKNDWRNRNIVKTPQGTTWITVPVLGGIHQMIYETKIDNSQNWAEKHMKTIQRNYAAAPYYHSYRDEINSIYAVNALTISELNIASIKIICKLLDLTTRFVNSVNLRVGGHKDDKLVEICQQIGAEEYLSGPAAKDYIDNSKFRNAGISLQYKDYSGYPEYPQLWGEFIHAVSIIDLICNCGEKAGNFIWGWRESRQ
jgi:hypothetical protein